MKGYGGGASQPQHPRLRRVVATVNNSVSTNNQRRNLDEMDQFFERY